MIPLQSEMTLYNLNSEFGMIEFQEITLISKAQTPETAYDIRSNTETTTRKTRLGQSLSARTHNRHYLSSSFGGVTALCCGQM